ncbi:hypothetical protein CTEN210_12700 [Chaetoceros tenuissimus]|uniref:EF-hand domain-containing protein n=1 Tax=Chaetoceros tenuissimus TaxID=426638 RepID=A0AAD3HAR0_9STRA|nr:hypothetical protein CTEN210_12700 [Chaetoceros tenuissimus]
MSKSNNQESFSEDGPRPTSSQQYLEVANVLRKSEAIDEKYHDIIVHQIQRMDQDKNGMIDNQELYEGIAESCKQAVENNRKVGKYKRIVLGLLVFVVLLAGANFATSWLAYEFGKDVMMDGDTLINKFGEAVKVSQNKVELMLVSTAWMTDEFISNVQRVMIQETIDEASHKVKKYYFNVAGMEIEPKESMLLTSALGDTITWNIIDKDNIHVTLASGETFTLSNGCSMCTSFSVLETDEILTAYQEYLDYFGFEHEHLHDGHSHRNLEHYIGCNKVING